MGSVHVFGMSLSFTATVPAHVLPHLVVGGPTVLHSAWDTEAMLDTIERRRGNFLIVPSPVLTEVAAAVRKRPQAAAPSPALCTPPPRRRLITSPTWWTPSASASSRAGA